MLQRCLSLVVLAVLGCVQVGHAQDGPTQDGKPDRSISHSGNGSEKSEPGLLSLLPADSVTEHSLKIDGRDLAYPQGQHMDAGSTQGARIMICGHRWTSHKAKAPLARWCDDAGISRLRHSDYGRVIEPDLRLALAQPRFRWLPST